MSAFGGKADMARTHLECPLLTQSGHWARAFNRTFKIGLVARGRHDRGLAESGRERSGKGQIRIIEQSNRTLGHTSCRTLSYFAAIRHVRRTRKCHGKHDEQGWI